MNARPLSVTVIGLVFVVFGCIALPVSLLRLFSAMSSADLAETYVQRPVELAFVSIVQLLAIVGGAFALRGLNWARWLLVGWLGYHVLRSLLHPPLELVVHSLLFAAVAYFLFRSDAAAYFRRARVEAQS
jgi:hypothetical protein